MRNPKEKVIAQLEVIRNVTSSERPVNALTLKGLYHIATSAQKGAKKLKG